MLFLTLLVSMHRSASRLPAEMVSDNNVNADHRYMLFSATFPSEARRLAKQYLLNNHIRIRVGRMGSSHKNIKQVVSTQLPHNISTEPFRLLKRVLGRSKRR